MSTTENAASQDAAAPASAVVAAAPAEVARPAAASDDNLPCQWEKCSERCPSAEALFDHICDKHVGRKSTNNLNLTCGWASCRTTTVKRDHITSHIRVHVPLKPHKCEFCGKAFKRPQDLKKHVKTHADDSVLLPSPDHNGHSSQGPGARQGGRAPGGYYDHGPQMHPGQGAPYGHHQAAPTGYYAPPQQSSYHPVYYGVPHNVSHAAEFSHHHHHQPSPYESRKRGLDALNDFFGDAKRRQIDASNYNHISRSLLGLQGLPIGGGGSVGLNEFVPSLVSVDGHGHGRQHAPMPQHQYALPLPNLRTKADLMNIDQFLEQMSQTVYESHNANTATSLHQPDLHYTHNGMNYRSSHSPPHHNLPHSAHTLPMMSSHSSQSNAGTPALTPSSSALSYTSGQSPVSSHGMSPISRHSSTASAAYPVLPAVTMGYSAHASTAPASTLGTNFDPDQRRRFSGGMLQRSNPQGGQPMDLSSDGSRTPSPRLPIPRLSSSTKARIDPALNGATSPISDSGASSDESDWLDNIRMVEALKELIKERIRKGDYEEEVDADTEMGGVEAKATTPKVEGKAVLYPTLRVSDD